MFDEKRVEMFLVLGGGLLGSGFTLITFTANLLAGILTAMIGVIFIVFTLIAIGEKRYLEGWYGEQKKS